MQRTRRYFPAATLAVALGTLGFVGLAIEPGSALLIAMGSALIAASR